jgi:hypothetical protein
MSAIRNEGTTGSRKKTDDPKTTCGVQLAKLRPRVASDDRRLAMKHFDLSYITISRYLGGNVKNLILGLNLLSFFKQLIDSRVNRLYELCDR